MPDSGGDTSPGSWQLRWSVAEHQRLSEHIGDIDERLTARVQALEDAFRAFAAEAAVTLTRRRDRQWTLAITFVTGLALPLLVTAIVALISSQVH